MSGVVGWRVVRGGGRGGVGRGKGGRALEPDADDAQAFVARVNVSPWSSSGRSMSLRVEPPDDGHLGVVAQIGAVAWASMVPWAMIVSPDLMLIRLGLSQAQGLDILPMEHSLRTSRISRP